MTPMDDLLLGYALNALDPADRRAVEVRLCDDPAARRRLDLLRRSIAPLAADREEPEPPPGLVARTLERILPVPASVTAGLSPRRRGEKLDHRCHRLLEAPCAARILSGVTGVALFRRRAGLSGL